MSLFLEFDQIVRGFNAGGIRYAVVGGLAIGLHGRLRATEDMDFLINPDDVEKAKGVLRGLGYHAFADPWTFRDSKTTLVRMMKAVPNSEDMEIVDLMIPGTVENTEILDRSISVPYAETSVKVATKKDLIAMKRQRSSKTDLSDIEYLEKPDDSD